VEKQTKKHMSDNDYYADTMEHEEVKRKSEPLNHDKGIYVNEFADGLNREKGVFHKTALFVAGRGEEK